MLCCGSSTRRDQGSSPTPSAPARHWVLGRQPRPEQGFVSRSHPTGYTAGQGLPQRMASETACMPEPVQADGACRWRCPEHSERPAELFCRRCSRCVCALCPVLGAHRGHPVGLAQEEAASVQVGSCGAWGVHAGLGGRRLNRGVTTEITDEGAPGRAGLTPTSR